MDLKDATKEEEAKFDPLSNLSPDQLTIFQEFRERLRKQFEQDQQTKSPQTPTKEEKKKSSSSPKLLPLTKEDLEWCDNACLCRYLRARDFNLDLSFNMLLETINWRKEAKPHLITYEDVKEQALARSNYLSGKDRYGHPTIVMKVSHDPPGTPEEKLRLIIYNIEEATRQMNKSKGVEKWNYVIHLGGFSLFKTRADPKMAMKWLTILQNHYPERLSSIFLVDSPSVFLTFYKLLTPLMNDVTKQKVHFFSGSFEEKRALFSTFFDPANLEESFGGDIKE
eukprot:TRINITY_DN3328_c0_g1_i2.p1 TRINITY_DN3328_c0_g1~~TRINITY_DN3328_c0_g1_i2.p1  ORF type:complete len:312 (-),score=93.70 TRINITY_DN3328_c0_g1_i2:262-1104(-)